MRTFKRLVAVLPAKGWRAMWIDQTAEGGVGLEELFAFAVYAVADCVANSCGLMNCSDTDHPFEEHIKIEPVGIDDQAMECVPIENINFARLVGPDVTPEALAKIIADEIEESKHLKAVPKPKTPNS